MKNGEDASIFFFLWNVSGEAINKPLEKLRAFWRGVGGDKKEIFLQIKLSFFSENQVADIPLIV